jgi:hypothetical protein
MTQTRPLIIGQRVASMKYEAVSRKEGWLIALSLWRLTFRSSFPCQETLRIVFVYYGGGIWPSGSCSYIIGLGFGIVVGASRRHPDDLGWILGRDGHIPITWFCDATSRPPSVCMVHEA